jgi:allophanate hydrolase
MQSRCRKLRCAGSAASQSALRTSPQPAQQLVCAANFTAVDVYSDLATLRAKRADAFAAIGAAGADYLVVPTVMHHYTVQELRSQEAADPMACTFNAYLGTFTNFVNLFGMCALSVPAGMLPDVELEARIWLLNSLEL